MSDGCHLKPRGAPPTFGRRRAALVATPSSSLITTSDKTTSAAAEFSFKCITGAVPGMNRILGARRSAKTRGDGGQGQRLQRRETAERKEPHIGGAVARQIADQRVVVAVRQGEIIQALVDRNATTCFRFTCLRRVGRPPLDCTKARRAASSRHRHCRGLRTSRTAYRLCRPPHRSRSRNRWRRCG